MVCLMEAFNREMAQTGDSLFPIDHRHNLDSFQTNAFSSTEINVAWRAPPSSTVHGQITGYRIEYGLTGRRKKSVTTDAETLVSYK